LLPKDARECLGKPHDDALPAMKMLTDEGFSYNQYVDIFDGGPLVDARVDDLRAVRQSRVVVIGEIANAPSGVDALIAAGAVADFRAIRAKARIEADALVIDRAAAAALAVEVGSIVRWAPW
jgi:arginine N-succinyltransferase